MVSWVHSLNKYVGNGLVYPWVSDDGQGPTVLAVGAGGGCLDIFFSRLSLLFSFSLSLGDDPT